MALLFFKRQQKYEIQFWIIDYEFFTPIFYPEKRDPERIKK